MESWVATGIFFGVALILVIFLIARTIYRCCKLNDTCRSCRKTTQKTEKPEKYVRRHSIAEELKNIGERQNSETNGPSFDRNISQTFDPQKPESLVLPVHGVHVLQPGEEDDDETIPTGGHGLDFYVGIEGYDEPDKKASMQKELRSPDKDDRGISNIKPNSIGESEPIGPQIHSSDVENESQIHTPRISSPNKLKPTDQSEDYQELILSEVSPPSNDYTALVRDGYAAGIGLENPVPVEDSDNEHTDGLPVYTV